MLRAAFNSARAYATTLVIAEDEAHARYLCNEFIRLPEVQERLQHNAARANQTTMEVDFWPAKPVRFFAKTSDLWDEATQHVRGYPPNTPLFIIGKEP